MTPCRHCGAALEQTFADLGMSPLANSYVDPKDRRGPETFYPLKVLACLKCLLVQLEDAPPPEALFSEYAYFSSFSESWLAHAKRFVDDASSRFSLGKESFVLEIASNDGYLLKNFVARGVPCLGVEPAKNIAAEAEKNGVPTLRSFFDIALARKLAGDGQRADLVIGNNVLAHVPRPQELLAAAAAVLKPEGVVCVEFPHLQRLVEHNEFDTIYHEHISYFSFLAVRRCFETAGLRVFDVEELPTHGGALRVMACLAAAARPETKRVAELAAREKKLGYEGAQIYAQFAERVRALKRDLLTLLVKLKREGKRVAAYGAPAKGNTLLNYCGIGADFVDFTVDRSPHKQGRLLPGTRIPIRPVEALREARPDYVLILPWNLKDEIVRQVSWIGEWGGRFVVPIPSPTVL